MAKPIPRRRGGTASSDDAPDADAYTSRSRQRSAEPEQPEEERRPRRGRGELPSAAKDDAPPAGSRRARAQARDIEPVGDSYPVTALELDELTDEKYDDLLDEFDINPDLDDNDAQDALWDAIEATRSLPAARSRRGRAEPEEEPEAKAPRGRRGRRSDPVEEEKPRRGGRSARSEDEDEDEEDRPHRVASKGFKGFQQTKAATSSYADDFKLSEEEVLVKFLDDEPFATYGEHGLYKELNDGQRVWVCLAPDETCAICDTGHNARAVALWNVVVIPEEGKPELKVLKAGPLLEKVIEKKAALKSGPMGREYYSLSQTPGKNDGPPVYAVEVIRERELEEEWSFKPFTDAALDDWLDKSYDESFVKFPSEKQVKDIARKLRDAD